MAHKKKILVSPLNWGLGHATRCIPIIQELIRKDVEVVLAAEEHPKALLQKEFPQLEFIDLPDYQITYPSGGNMAVHMLKLMPKILNNIKKEGEALDQYIDELGIDGVIADNRFGLHSSKVPTVFITHQVMIKAPFGENLLQKLNARFINKFDHCWIPDFEGEDNLSGDLSHKYEVPKHATFIGPLSRFLSQKSTQKYDLIAIISGPEPQRTMFQHIIHTELEMSKATALMVLGKAGENIHQNHERIDTVAHLPAKELQEAIAQSKMVISRSGYSSLMDLAIMGKPAILIPTPGQTEQEYLAHYHFEKKHYFSVEQDQFNLDEALEQSKTFKGITVQPQQKCLQKAIHDFIATL
tara:strand:- start:3443 stop:4504 length:1062 start_codon:yes stop_codon:yes gene_type:complete